MLKINPKSVYFIAKKEFMDNIRNKWIISLTIIFVIMTIASSYLAGRQAESPKAMPYSAFKESYQSIITVSMVEGERIDLPGLEPGDTIIIRDRLAYIASQQNLSINMTVTYVWFNSSHLGEDESHWYNPSLSRYTNFDLIIEGDLTGNYSIGDRMDITLHVIEADSDTIKGEFLEEMWDDENDVPTLVLPSSVLLAEKEESSAFGGMEETVIIHLTISVVLIPLIAIMLGYATISGEAESGALSVVLSYPIRRKEVLLGKFFGLGMVLVVSTVLGFGAGGIVIAATVGAEEGGGYLAFIGLVSLLGLLYLSLSIFFSVLSKKRVTSLVAGILIFFWSMILGIIVFGLYSLTGGDWNQLMSGQATFPDWLWYFIFVSPMDMNQMSVMQVFGIEEAFGIPIVAPGFMNLANIVIAHLVWIIVPLLLALYFFDKRDL